MKWNTTVSDIREQFPLRVEDTLHLAGEAKIRHPEVGGYTQVMSSDFVVDFSASSGARRMAIQVKSSSDLKDSRTIEKLELERRYWQQKGLPVYLDFLDAHSSTKLPEVAMLIDRRFSMR
ncbi:TnsA endonuclease N-terminal domain-containing protein [Marinobacter sp.]|uniref:TnsA endonuclease N-terminal domain-containing protein n=1 Tax=Marinobacter sp. TaxID=50741 RepID=UPI003F9CA182